jgi:phage tail-like protein
MAEWRANPYLQFNFLVNLGPGANDPGQNDAGFQEVSNIGTEVAVTEYRNGNEKRNNVRKITGLNKSTDVTMKRGVMGTLTLFNWLKAIREGDQNGGMRTVVIQLQSEDRKAIAQTWTLHGARIMKYVCGPFSAKGNDVAMEELTLAYEWLDIE